MTYLENAIKNMKVKNEIYNRMLRCPDVPPETGGILGTGDGRVIDYFVFDRGLYSDNGGVYIPDIVFLNQTISEWTEKGIQFLGLFHTHAVQWPDLSENDRIYIKDIFNGMPPEIVYLYFPLVFPNRYIKGYLAKREKGIVHITEEHIEVCREEVQSL